MRHFISRFIIYEKVQKNPIWASCSVLPIAVKIEFRPTAFILDAHYRMQSKSIISKRSCHLMTLSRLHKLCNVDHIWMFGPVHITANRDGWHQRRNVRNAILPTKTPVGTSHNSVQEFYLLGLDRSVLYMDYERDYQRNTSHLPVS
jgi:hypothetical protein